MNNKIKICLSCLMLLIAFQTTALAERFGVVNIELGEERQTILQKLSMYELLDLGDSVAVFTKSNKDTVGVLFFKKNARLESINKEWATYKDINQGKLLSDMIDMYTRGTETNALVSVKKKSAASFEFSTIYIKLLTVPMRTIEIMVF